MTFGFCLDACDKGEQPEQQRYTILKRWKFISDFPLPECFGTREQKADSSYCNAFQVYEANIEERQ